MCNAYCKFHAFSMDSVCSLPLMSICTPNILYPSDVPPYGKPITSTLLPRSIQPTTAARSSMGDDPIAATPLTGWARTSWDVMMSCHESPQRSTKIITTIGKNMKKYDRSTKPYVEYSNLPLGALGCSSVPFHAPFWFHQSRCTSMVEIGTLYCG